MFTLVKCVGLVYDLEANRPWTTCDLMTSMGLPITEGHQALVGRSCTFSRTVEAHCGRRHRSAAMQAGNVMHVAVIGSSVLLVLLALPRLGQLQAPTTSARSAGTLPVVSPTSVLPAVVSDQGSDTSKFEEAMARMKRRRLNRAASQ
jgi:hypothetical protein